MAKMTLIEAIKHCEEKAKEQREIAKCYISTEYPICEHLTNCEDNIDELHYCWNCGAKMLNAADVALADASAKKPEEKNGGKP